MIIPGFEEAKRLAKGHTVVPVAMEMFSDVKTSIEILKNIRGASDKYFMLESVTGADTWGRYTFLGYDPQLTVQVLDGVTTVKDGDGERALQGEPMACLREVLSEYNSPRIAALPPFTGGFVGYFSYDFVKYFEPSLQLKAENDEGFLDLQLMLMDKVIAFDHFRQKIWLIVNVAAENIEENYITAVTRLKDMERLILAATPAEQPNPGRCGPFTPSFTLEEYSEVVERAKHYIREGDIFQVVPSNRQTADFEGDLMETYRVLRTMNPSPYMFYLHFDEIEIAGASPETLISLQDGEVATYPLAGTCPRGKTAAEDKALIEALLADGKELSEHDMLVDLGRNDLGKVSEFGSVEVVEYRQIKKYSHVSHIASKVTGQIREGLDALDAVAATLPAGTLSGAPKKRACEIIDELEGKRRGVYGGAVGYIDFTGNMDLCIGIRMVVHKNGKVFVQSGGGIVADSVPEKEYTETINKAQAVIRALQYKKEG